MITGIQIEPRAAMIGSQRLPLSPTEAKVLELILAAGDAPISRLQIEQQIYGASGRKSNTIEVAICRLRGKIAAHGYRILATRGRGYTVSKCGAA
ncbi:winged helix-turn-helix domain-containing protein [Stenotrophomonas sp. TD3]|uniref:winged helix-turn-helix domain-containing protein n=1 Tax=Stenotrophomonas sp. TD3 TaxID=1641707 RepID=UPI000951838E|nr:winged helix-turn-helix domain-containing protein [Stenotrophomonas sp. TD3]